MRMKVVEAFETDKKAIRQIGVDTYREFDSSIWSVESKEKYIESQFNLEKLTNDLNNSAIKYFLIYAENEIVGFIKLKLDQVLPNSDHEIGLELEKIYLLQKASGQGLGKAAMDFVIDFAKTKGNDFVWLDALKTNLRALTFYEKYGFKKFSEIDFSTDVAKPDMWVMKFEISNMKSQTECFIRNAKPEEFSKIGQLMVKVYSQLEGFPQPDEQPQYYKLLANVGQLTENPKTEILVIANDDDKILGAVVYIGDMQYYGSGGTATQEKNAAGFRLLAVDSAARGLGLGKLLTRACIEKAKGENLSQLIIHTTQTMKTAWKMYEKFGFKRSEDLDFKQGELSVCGFRLLLFGN